MSRLAAALAALALAGCASVEPVAPMPTRGADAPCLQWLAALDAAVDRAGVRDAETDRIAGFPALRVDRLSAALASRARQSEAAFDAWLERLRDNGLAAHRVELANLGQAAPAEFAGRDAAQRLQQCSEGLAASVRADADARRALLERARVPDRYSGAQRALGLYAMTRHSFLIGVQQFQASHERAMEEAMAEPRPSRRFAPEAATAPPGIPGPDAAVRFERDALGLPRIDAALAQRLLAAHAPVFEIEQRGAFDDFGALGWRDDGSVDVDRSRPVVYQRVAQTVVGGEAWLQLVYTLWFPERPRQRLFDVLFGHLDGVIVRLTLSPDGRPRMLDTIHPCGCYHMFFPGPGVAARPGAPTDEEWAWVPGRLPDLQPGERVVVRIASATHYVLGLSSATGRGGPPQRTYALRPEADLRNLPRPAGGTRSAYGPDGLIAGTERAERFFYWPVGILSTGAMRQWGHHATAFVGRRHFDDADLLDKRFDFSRAQ